MNSLAHLTPLIWGRLGQQIIQPHLPDDTDKHLPHECPQIKITPACSQVCRERGQEAGDTNHVWHLLTRLLASGGTGSAAGGGSVTQVTCHVLTGREEWRGLEWSPFMCPGSAHLGGSASLENLQRECRDHDARLDKSFALLRTICRMGSYDVPYHPSQILGDPNARFPSEWGDTGCRPQSAALNGVIPKASFLLRASHLHPQQLPTELELTPLAPHL